MGVTHHANYIRWMEVARIDLMDRIGFPYKRMEEEGVLSPVKSMREGRGEIPSLYPIHVRRFDHFSDVTVWVSENLPVLRKVSVRSVDYTYMLMLSMPVYAAGRSSSRISSSIFSTILQELSDAVSTMAS